MTLFRGQRISGKASVQMEGHPLSPRWSQSIRNHSPDGFEWGLEGSGPAQLSLAILLQETNVAEARLAYQDFKRTVVSRWDGDTWAATSEGIQVWLASWRLANPDKLCGEEVDPDECCIICQAALRSGGN